MRKKKYFVIILIFAFSIVIILTVSQERDLTSQEAIEQASNYKPGGACTDAVVPAVHRETGAKYTFPSGCLAPGWVPEN